MPFADAVSLAGSLVRLGSLADLIWGTMDRIRITGGNKLNGTIPISGAKNAALPLMTAALLTEETLDSRQCASRLADVLLLQRILGNHGVDIMTSGKRSGDSEYQGQTLHISAKTSSSTPSRYKSWCRRCARASGSRR